MPLSALVFYLQAKYEHETVRDNYFADILRYAAWANVKEPEKLPRYYDAVHKRERDVKPQKSADDILMEILMS
jgi:hypothetical protein